MAPGSTFVPSLGNEATAPDSFRRDRTAASGWTVASARGRIADLARRLPPMRFVGIVLLVLAAVVLLVPHGPSIVGALLMVLGCAMILVGFGVGAYGAFHEDSLYGLLYVFVPLYSAYYLVTRWDDLWPWFLCSTAGATFAMIGIELAHWG